MIDQEQAARTLINLIDVVHQENWVLLNKEDMASKTEEYYINFFKEHHLEEAIDEIKAVTEKNKSFLVLNLRHRRNRKRLYRNFLNLKRISRPGLRIYSNYQRIPRILGGMGVVILSTSRGIMTDRRARIEGIGGEILCYIW